MHYCPSLPLAFHFTFGKVDLHNKSSWTPMFPVHVKGPQHTGSIRYESPASSATNPIVRPSTGSGFGHIVNHLFRSTSLPNHTTPCPNSSRDITTKPASKTATMTLTACLAVALLMGVQLCWASNTNQGVQNPFISTAFAEDLASSAVLTSDMKNEYDTDSKVFHLQYKPLKEVQTPKYTRTVLSNGMVVFLLEDHAVPIVNSVLNFPSGSRLDPADKTGLSPFCAFLLRNGQGEDLDVFLESHAASIEASASSTVLSMSFSAFSDEENLGPVQDRFVAMIKNPKFLQDKLDFVKNQTKGNISRRNDDPNGIAQREFLKLIYGDSSPYSRTLEYKTVDSITLEDIAARYDQATNPQGAVMGVVGDFDTQTMLNWIRDNFDSWNLSEKKPKPIPPDVTVQQYKNAVIVVDKPELSQAYVRLGSLGGRLDDPDYYALDVLNQIWNGLGGTLFNEVRSKAGLAYTVSAEWYPGYDHNGFFLAEGQTKADQAGLFISKLLESLRKSDENLPSLQEIEEAKSSSLNSLVFNYTSKASILTRLMRYEIYSYPLDFFERYREGIKRVSPQDVLRVSNEKIQEGDFIFLVVGKKFAVLPSLKALEMPILMRDISIPGP